MQASQFSFSTYFKILAIKFSLGMASFEDVTPTVLQSWVPQESQANMKNKVLKNRFLLVVLSSALVFLKVCSWGSRSPRNVNAIQMEAAV